MGPSDQPTVLDMRLCSLIRPAGVVTYDVMSTLLLLCSSWSFSEYTLIVWRFFSGHD